ncbi:MAG: hypothetical protein A2W93_11775 [Bacteroidetes bacterium GWF2_43_63]|nr:MAG: hypothetical protein A2W94_14645 [Bacteroidetes bacterium GWE2_42_42]OFY54945.1 MAG: hypothetical protein A2W93_11775 [Bacteroidetes bacterium GWF2_43_63]HCB63144.1 hypothetical protein [Bacteroidales bacterium]HCY22251.1 hypothetical protein [Bacteroidales bacterium]
MTQLRGSRYLSGQVMKMHILRLFHIVKGCNIPPFGDKNFALGARLPTRDLNVLISSFDEHGTVAPGLVLPTACPPTGGIPGQHAEWLILYCWSLPLRRLRSKLQRRAKMSGKILQLTIQRREIAAQCTQVGLGLKSREMLFITNKKSNPRNGSCFEISKYLV